MKKINRLFSLALLISAGAIITSCSSGENKYTEKEVKRIYADWVKKNYPIQYFALFEGINEVPNYARYLEHIKYKEILSILEKEGKNNDL
jgi:hypothetical protein